MKREFSSHQMAKSMFKLGTFILSVTENKIFNQLLMSWTLIAQSTLLYQGMHTYYYSKLIHIVSGGVDISWSKYQTRRGASSVMGKIWKYPHGMIQCIRSRYCIDNLFITYLFLKRNSIFKSNYVGTFHVSFCMLTNIIPSNVISLLLSDDDTGSE